MPKGEKKAGGRPKQTKVWSDKLKKSVKRALDKFAKDKGMDFAEVLVAMFYDTSVMDTARIGVAKVICDILVVKESQRTVENKSTGPSIGLPPVMRKPESLEEEEVQRLHG
ncbi:MAG: hypothetical protein ABIJ12_14220 [bacterium]